MNRICIVSPFPPPFGGMAVQAEKLSTLLEKEGFQVTKVATNVELPSALSFVNGIPFIRTFARLLLFLIRLNQAVNRAETVYMLSGFFSFFFWVTYPAVLLLLLRHKKVILSARGGGARLFFKKNRVFIKPILRKLDAITVPSGFLKAAFLEELEIDTIVLPNIADLKQFKFRRRDRFSPRLIVTRSLEEIYDLPTVIKAFSRIKSRYPEAHLGILGGGSLRQMLETMVEESGLKKNVTFYGEVTHNRIFEIYNQYDIFINASKVDNLPGSVLEAFAAGLPVVSTRAGGIPFMVTHRENGLLSDIGDDKTLAEHVRQILETPDLGRALTMKGYGELRRYTWPYIKTVLFPLLTDE